MTTGQDVLVFPLFIRNLSWRRNNDVSVMLAQFNSQQDSTQVDINIKFCSKVYSLEKNPGN